MAGQTAKDKIKTVRNSKGKNSKAKPLYHFSFASNKICCIIKL